ncbi:MAG: LON peptidase substrate-binding domain-containing protein, partial [Gemmatimonadaceae bacterium]
MMQRFLRDSEIIETSGRLPVLPLRDVVLFPHVAMPLLVGRAGSLAALEAAEASDKLVLLMTQRDSSVQDPAAADLFRTGTLGRVLQFTRLPNGAARVLVEGLARAQVTKFVAGAKLLRAEARPYPFTVAPGDGAEDEARKALALFEEYVTHHRRLPPEVTSLVQAASSLERQGCGIAAHLALRHETRQTLLEAPRLVDLFRALT